MTRTMRLTMAGALTVLMASACSWGRIAIQPLEPAVLGSDLVVVCTASEAGEATEMNVALPGQKTPTNRWMRSATLKVTEVILDADGTQGKSKTVTVLTMAIAPQPKVQEGQPIPGRGRLSSRGRFNLKLKVGTSYVLLLTKMAGRKEFYLRSIPTHVQTASKATVDRVRKIGKVDAWPWGKADGRGLQIAAVQGGGYGGGATGVLYAYKGNVSVSVIVALRNTSAKPISVDLDPAHKAIQLEAVDSKGALVQGDPYKNMRIRPQPGRSYVLTLAPGKMKLIGVMGPVSYAVRVQMTLETGPHKVRAVFALPKDTDAKANWSGSIRSGETTIEVKQRPVRAPGPVRRAAVPPVRRWRSERSTSV